MHNEGDAAAPGRRGGAGYGAGKGGILMTTRPANFDYQTYLASREWALLKEQVRERCDGWCEHCSAGPYQDTHHVTYERIGHEKIDDLMAVCRPCHEWLSAKRERNPLNDSYIITERLIRERDGQALHLIWQRRNESSYENWYDGDQFYALCGPQFSVLNKCVWCDARLEPLLTFSYAIWYDKIKP